jgi:hypothetical protein
LVIFFAIAYVWAWLIFVPLVIFRGRLEWTAVAALGPTIAALVTHPGNQRFARVIANRLWQRNLGRGLIEPVEDWNEADCSHPSLLDYLARELVTHDYDLQHVARLIFQSHTYQRASSASRKTTAPVCQPAVPRALPADVSQRAPKFADSNLCWCRAKSSFPL